MNAPIDDELREYVQAFRATDRPDPAAHANTWARIEATIAADRPRAPRTTPWLLLALAAGVALTIGLAAALPRRTASPTRDLSNYQHIPESPHTTPAPPPSLDRTSSPPPPTPGPAADPTPAATPDPPRSAPTRRRPPPTSPSLRPEEVASLRPEEVASFRTAQAALTDDDGETALQLLDAHGRRFPGGVFEEERQVARATALCKLGRVADAHALRDEFLAAHPGSHLAPRMRHSCREIE